MEPTIHSYSIQSSSYDHVPSANSDCSAVTSGRLSGPDTEDQLPELPGLTCHHGVRAVPLGILLSPSHTAGAGLGLIGAQGLPLALQTVLVLQVVLHVRLRGKKTVRERAGGPLGENSKQGA